jgi:hypothetical protein
VTTVLKLVEGAWSEFNRKKSAKAAERALANERQRHRFERIYSPMSALFITTHITSANATLAPFLRQRLEHAWSAAKHGRLKAAVRAISDRRETRETAEVEFGPGFPLDEIKRILSGNEAYADEDLLELVRLADRSRYEVQLSNRHQCSLTDEELGLFRHIARTRSRLAARLDAPGRNGGPHSA